MYGIIWIGSYWMLLCQDCSASHPQIEALILVIFFPFFPPLVLRCVPHCSSLLKSPQPFLSSLFVSVSFCNLGPWVRSINVLFFLSSEAALQWKVLGYISVSSQLFQFLDFYGYRDLSCPTFHLTFGKSQPWATFPSHLPACVYSHLILPSLTSSCSSSVSYELTSPNIYAKRNGCSQP